jgi:hypothetical protein
VADRLMRVDGDLARFLDEQAVIEKKSNAEELLNYLLEEYRDGVEARAATARECYTQSARPKSRAS